MKKKVKKTHVKHKRKKIYYGYNARIIINSIVFALLLIVGLFVLKQSLNVEDSKVVNYSEQSYLDYKVYLKQNNFYEDKFLPKDMLYVASLIDKINIDFNYKFSIEEQIDLNFEYKILGKLVISDENEENIYYEKIYNLMDEKNLILKENKIKSINESIEIDYEKYNKIANNFKSNYGINTKNKLIIYFNINKEALNNDDKKLLVSNQISNMIINIPLSEKSVDISLKYQDINNQSSVIDNHKVVIDNIICLIISIILIILSIVFMIKTMRLFKHIIKKKDIYREYINKILNEYDRLIVETTTPPIMKEEDKDKVIIIEKFTELLDVRDNLKQPIMYFVVAKHQKCHFYINSGEKIYLTTIKKVDLEVQDEKK